MRKDGEGEGGFGQEQVGGERQRREGGGSRSINV